MSTRPRYILLVLFSGPALGLLFIETRERGACVSRVLGFVSLHNV